MARPPYSAHRARRRTDRGRAPLRGASGSRRRVANRPPSPWSLNPLTVYLSEDVSGETRTPVNRISNTFRLKRALRPTPRARAFSQAPAPGSWVRDRRRHGLEAVRPTRTSMENLEGTPDEENVFSLRIDGTGMLFVDAPTLWSDTAVQLLVQGSGLYEKIRTAINSLSTSVGTSAAERRRRARARPNPCDDVRGPDHPPGRSRRNFTT